MAILKTDDPSRRNDLQYTQDETDPSRRTPNYTSYRFETQHRFEVADRFSPFRGTKQDRRTVRSPRDDPVCIFIVSASPAGS